MMTYKAKNGGLFVTDNDNLITTLERLGFVLVVKTLQDYTVKELKAMCEQKDIEIPASVIKKDDIIALLG